MSDRKSFADLGPNAEALLSSFPFPERDWEKGALDVEASVARAGDAETDAALLTAPFPSEPGEADAPLSATQTPLANSGVRTHSLAALARRTVENKHAADREVARAALALAARERPTAEEVLALRDAMSSQLESERASALPTPVRAEPPGSAARVRPLALAAAAISLAVGTLFWFEHTTPKPLVTAVLSAPGAPETAGDVPPGASNAPALQGVPTGIDPSTLPAVSSTSSAEPAREKAVARAAPSVTGNALHGAEKVVLEDDPVATAMDEATSEAPIAKTLPPDPALRPAESTGGSVPAKPSTGAVQAALGAVMSGARHCVAGGDGPSSAVVVFASDGHVERVAVSGPAAGKPAGSCIEAQLRRARVQPFAVQNFSVNATVRPD